MRLAALLCLGLMGCSALAERPDSDHESKPEPPSSSAGNGGSGGSAGSLTLFVAGSVSSPTLDLGGSSSGPAPEPEPDWCETAKQNGATFCETDNWVLDWCEPAPADGAACPVYDLAPGWAYDLLLKCEAHCGVVMRPSERTLEGSCCYIGVAAYYGR